MRVVASGAMLVAFAATACGNRIVIPAVPNEGGRPTEILAIGSDPLDHPEIVYVIDLADAGAPLAFEVPREPRTLEAYLLPKTVSELRLTPGRHTLDDGGAMMTDEVWTAAFAPGEDVAWKVPGDEPAWQSRIRLPLPDDPEECVTSGRCLLDGACRDRCDDPGVEAPDGNTVPAFDCPAGWAPLTLETAPDIVVCDPRFEEKPCDPTQIRLPGETACRDIAPACDGAGFAPLEANETGRRVRTGGSPTADPFDTIDNALAAANPGDVILVSGGDYAGAVIDVPVTIRGVCPQQTRIGPIGASVDLTIEDVSIERVQSTANLTLRRTIVAEGAGTAVLAGGTTNAELVSIRGPYDVGIDVPGALDATSLYLEGMHSALTVGDDGDATIRRARVRATQNSVRVDGSATIREASFEGGEGLVATGALDLEDVVVSDVDTALTLDAADGELEDVWIARVRIGVSASSSTVTATDLVVVDTTEGGWAGTVAHSVSTFRRVALLDLAGSGVGGVYGVTTVEHLFVRRVGGDGVSAQLEEHLTLRRADLADLHGVAVGIAETATATIADVRVAASGMSICRTCTGVCIGENSIGHVERLDMEDVHGAAFGVDRGLADIENLRIFATKRGRSCPDSSRGDGEGIVIDGSIVTFRKLFVGESPKSAIRLENTQVFQTELSIQSGLIIAADIGIDVRLADDNWAASIEGVTFEDVRRPVQLVE